MIICTHICNIPYQFTQYNMLRQIKGSLQMGNSHACKNSTIHAISRSASLASPNPFVLSSKLLNDYNTVSMRSWGT